jgi:hypothetical protein
MNILAPRLEFLAIPDAVIGKTTLKGTGSAVPQLSYTGDGFSRWGTVLSACQRMTHR